LRHGHTKVTFCVETEVLTRVTLNEEFVTPFSLAIEGSFLGFEVLIRMTVKNM
jgi:hypothetical protein